MHYVLSSIARIWAGEDKGKKIFKVLFVRTCLYTFQECGEWQATREALYLWSISCPPCRLASYLLNETVPTDLDNRTLASAPHSLHWELCCITESPCARAKQHRQPWTKQWVDMGSHIIGSFKCCHSLSLTTAAVFSLLVISYHRYYMTVTWYYERYAWDSRFNSHSLTYHLDGCVAVIPVAVDSFHLSLCCCHVSSQAIRQAEMHPATLTHDLIWLIVSHPGPELIGSIKCTHGTRSWVSALSSDFHRPQAQGVSQTLSRSSANSSQPTQTYWDRAACHVRRECQSPSGPMDKTGAHSWDLTCCLLVNKSLSPLRTESTGRWWLSRAER